MGKKKKKKTWNHQKTVEQIRRENEISEYSRILSLRPSIAHKSGKEYKREKYRYNPSEE